MHANHCGNTLTHTRTTHTENIKWCAHTQAKQYSSLFLRLKATYPLCPARQITHNTVKGKVLG